MSFAKVTTNSKIIFLRTVNFICVKLQFNRKVVLKDIPALVTFFCDSDYAQIQ